MRPIVHLFLWHPMSTPTALIAQRAFVRDGDVDVLFVIGSDKVARTIPEDARPNCRKMSPDGRVVSFESLGHYETPSPKSALLERVASLNASAALAVRAASLAFELRRLVRLFVKFLDEAGPDVVVVFDDRISDTDLSFLKACRRLSLVTILLSQNQFDPDASAFSRLDQASYYVDRAPHVRLKRWLFHRFPGQGFASPFGDMLFYPPEKTIALWLAGMLPRKPWIRGGSGLLGQLGVAHFRDLEKRARFGADLTPATVIGPVVADAMMEIAQERGKLRNALQDEFGWSGSKPLIVCAVPQFWTNIPSWTEADFCSLFRCLAGSESTVLLSLHPKVMRSDYPFLEETQNLRISSRPLDRILPAADLFVATESSTLDWAVLLEICCIVVDFIEVPTRSPSLWPDLPHCYHAAEFEEMLPRFLGDAAWRSELEDSVKRMRKGFCPEDGGSTERMVSLIRGALQGRRDS